MRDFEKLKNFIDIFLKEEDREELMKTIDDIRDAAIKSMENDEAVERAYSMASYPAEGREIMLIVSIAAPPWDRSNNGWMDSTMKENTKMEQNQEKEF